MSKDWGPTAFLLGAGGLLVWKSMNSESRATFWNLLAESYTSPHPIHPAPVVLPVTIEPATAEPGTPDSGNPLWSDDMIARIAALGRDPKNPIVTPMPTLNVDEKYRKVITHPSVGLILGKRGSGKSALAYRLLELFRNHRTPFAVGIPQSAARLLPDWIGVVDSLASVPPGSIAVVDEAHLMFHSRKSSSALNRELSELLNLSRQNDLTVIFVSQEARQIDRNIASSANLLIFKQPSMLQAEFERSEMRHLADQAAQSFAGLAQLAKPRWSFVFAPDVDFTGMLENELPSFWSSKLSKAFAGKRSEQRAKPRKATELSMTEKQGEAIRLRADGWSLSRIADHLGVSKGTVVNYVKGYPYRNL